MTKIPRSSGLLLHISSLAGSPYNGDLGQPAYDFIDFLASSGQKWWQTLPINPYGKGHSPYSTICSLAGEPLYIGLDGLCRDGLISRKDISNLKVDQPRVSYREAERERYKVYSKAFEAFLAPSNQKKFATEIQSFRKEHRYWLADFTLFQPLARGYGPDWSQWPSDIRNREPAALRAARVAMKDSCHFSEFLQFQFFRQWQRLKSYAKAKGVGFIGDIPIFVSHGSVDVWAHQKHFQLDRNGQCSYVAGVPPDYYNKDGQLWGNALYNWPQHQQTKFAWWSKRINFLTKQFDVIRLDHFIGFHRYWRIPASATSAKTGRWCPSPGHALFSQLKRSSPNANFIAEDLGLVTPEVWALRDQFDIPGMRVLQFAFGSDDDIHYHMPYSCPENAAIYTGTHDNDTAAGWYAAVRAQRHKPKPDFSWSKVSALLGTNKQQAVYELTKLAMMSPANLAITPMQDILGLGRAARMNTPGTPSGNWRWRLPPDGVDFKEIAGSLHELTKASGR